MVGLIESEEILNARTPRIRAGKFSLENMKIEVQTNTAPTAYDGHLSF